MLLSCHRYVQSWILGRRFVPHSKNHENIRDACDGNNNNVIDVSLVSLGVLLGSHHLFRQREPAKKRNRSHVSQQRKLAKNRNDRLISFLTFGLRLFDFPFRCYINFSVGLESRRAQSRSPKFQKEPTYLTTLPTACNRFVWIWELRKNDMGR